MRFGVETKDFDRRLRPTRFRTVSLPRRARATIITATEDKEVRMVSRALTGVVLISVSSSELSQDPLFFDTVGVVAIPTYSFPVGRSVSFVIPPQSQVWARSGVSTGATFTYLIADSLDDDIGDSV